MKDRGKKARQLLGCGWEQPLKRAVPWSPRSSMNVGWPTEIETCPGYTTKLPAVLDVCRGRVHWEKNAAAFAAFCEGEPTEQMLAAVEILEGSINEVRSWSLENPEKTQ